MNTKKVQQLLNLKPGNRSIITVIKIRKYAKKAEQDLKNTAKKFAWVYLSF